MRNSGSSPKGGGQQRCFSDFFASGACTVRGPGVNIETVRTLCGACYRNRKEFSVLPGNCPVFSSDNLVELDEGREFCGREPLEFAQ